MKAPVIFLTFANDPNDHLALLKRERKNITRSLRDHDTDNQIKLVTEAGTTVEDIFEIFRAYEDRIAIFHYGGHAGDDHLRLEDDGDGSSDASASGLAQFLGSQQSLQLVFLNGCATGPQVDTLLNNGVKVVIATATKIQDKMATEFAEQFYYAIAHYASIQRAFDTATTFIKTKYQDHKPIEIYRGSRKRGETSQNPDELPWGLFVGEGGEDHLEWTLPKTSQIEKTIRGRMAYEERLEVNDLLIDTVCEDLALYSTDLDFELSKESLDIPRIILKIVDCFPLPIGEQLRKLFTSSDDPSQPDEMELFTETRLRQIYQTHRATAQFIAYILMSQLWDAKFANPDIDINDDDIVPFNSFFAMSEMNYQTFNYFSIIRVVTNIFDAHNIQYFLEELKQVKINASPEGELAKAYDFLEALKVDLENNQIDKSDLENICLQAEEALGQFLRTVAFLAKYKLATIKNIEIIKRRHEDAHFRHNQIELNKAMTVAATKATEVGEVFKNYTDSKSVLFIKTQNDEIIGYLSLSPFVIDLNALNNEYKSKLYLFTYQEGSNYYYQFLNNNNDELLAVNDKQYKSVKDEVEKFKANINGQQFISAPITTERKQSRFSRKK